jgi:hypothetical protein
MSMNAMQACGVVANGRDADSLLVCTMMSMFIFDAIESQAGPLAGVPTLGSQHGLSIGFAASKLKPGLAKDSPEGLAALRQSRISSVPLMGGAAGLGLGLALAQPERQVIVMDGDASLLMELGGLVTVAQARPKHFLHVVINNGTQFTGFDNMRAPAPAFDFAAAARNSGYARAESIEDAATWAKLFPELCAAEGPVFVCLKVDPVAKRTQMGFVHPEMPDQQFDRMGQECTRLQHWLRQGL